MTTPVVPIRSDVDARVSVRVVDPARIDLLLRLPAPVRHRHRVEQGVLARYLDATRKSSQSTVPSTPDAPVSDRR